MMCGSRTETKIMTLQSRQPLSKMLERPVRQPHPSFCVSLQVLLRGVWRSQPSQAWFGLTHLLAPQAFGHVHTQGKLHRVISHMVRDDFVSNGWKVTNTFPTNNQIKRQISLERHPLLIEMQKRDCSVYLK